MLDVATGTGNAALQAAAAGAQVVGLDLTPGAARDRAHGAPQRQRVAVDWLEGDAEELPFEDERFDRVLSVFGVQFAPRHARRRRGARARLPPRRPDRPRQLDAGRARSASSSGSSAGTCRRRPAYASPPPLWGDEHARARAVRRTRGVELEFARGHNPWRFDSAEHCVAFMETKLRPAGQGARAADGRGPLGDCRAEILALAERRNEATDGSLLLLAEYLVVTGTKAAA